MAIREWLNEHSSVSSSIALLVVVATLGYVSLRTFGGRAGGELPQRHWFYNLNEKKLFGDAATNVAPFKTADGHDAVKAVVYHCGSCSEPQNIAYLEKYTTKGKQRIKKKQQELKADGEDPSMAYMMVNQMGMGQPLGQYVSRVEPVRWVNTANPQAAIIIPDLSTICSGKKLVMNCFPSE